MFIECAILTGMKTVTIPKKLAGKDSFVIIPRKEYEALLELKRFKEFNPTKAQKRALLRAENNLRKGKTLTHHELVKRLGFAR
jgi:hypothetical protein